jgi:hypothetical protein
MRLQESIIQHLILRLHTRHECIFREVIGPAGILLVGARYLFVEGLDVWGQEPVQGEFLALVRWEGASFVVVAVSEEVGALR